jgi:MarR family transcriptional regulator for hemolysin
MTTDRKKSARTLLEVVPLIMQGIRSEMRNRRLLDLTVPQFRTLAFVNRNEGSSLLEAANHVGLTPPSMSKLVDGLIARGLMARKDDPDDRRRVRLNVTNRGLAILETVTQETLSYLADKLGNLDADKRAAIDTAMEALRTVFAIAHGQER